MLWHWGPDLSPLRCPAWEAGTGLLEGRACGSDLGAPALRAATHGTLIVQAREKPATIGFTVCGSGRIHNKLRHTEHPLTWAEDEVDRRPPSILSEHPLSESSYLTRREREGNKAYSAMKMSHHE